MQQSAHDLVYSIEPGAATAPKSIIPIAVAVEAPAWEMPGTIEGKIERAEGVLTRLLKNGTPVCVSWSAGKDSSTVLNLLLSAAAKLAALKDPAHPVPPIVVTHADTMIENPEMVTYAHKEMSGVRKFAKEHGLNVTIEISKPNLTDQWSVRVIGGRALPPFPGTNRDCSMDWKASPMKKLRKSVLKQLSGAGELGEPVVLIGTRYDESAERARNMRERGESDVQVRRGVDENGKESHLFLSPIAFWGADDVWEYLGYAQAGAILAYSDFEDTFRVYADAMGTSCVIVAEDMSKAMKSSKACGARHGCSLCTAVGRDQSMENMLATDERYAYMRPLNAFRNFLTATRWDMGRRSWLGRTIERGFIRVAPDAYSPAMMEELLRYALTIDIEEQFAARAAGLKRPRFQLINLEQLFAIDAMWSLQAFHRPFHALKIYNDVYNLGHRYPVPDVPAFSKPKEMPVRYLWVGNDWDEGNAFDYTGLRSVTRDLASLDFGHCMGTRVVSNGRQVMDVETGSMLEFDEETMFFVLDELDELMARHDNERYAPTEAYTYYLGLGFMSIKSGMEGEVDKILRRSSWKLRQGVAGEVDHTLIWDRTVTAGEAGFGASTNGKLRKKGAAGSKSVLHEDLSAVPPVVEATVAQATVAADEPELVAEVIVATTEPIAVGAQLEMAFEA